MIQNQKNNLLRGALMGFLMMVPAAAFGADDATTILSTAHSTLLGMASLIINVVSIVMGLVGVVMLGVNLAKYLKGDPSSNDALMKVGSGVLIAVVILQILRVTLIK